MKFLRFWARGRLKIVSQVKIVTAWVLLEVILRWRVGLGSLLLLLPRVIGEGWMWRLIERVERFGVVSDMSDL